MNINNNIKKLLESSSEEDIKLGIFLFCKYNESEVLHSMRHYVPIFENLAFHFQKTFYFGFKDKLFFVSNRNHNIYLVSELKKQDLTYTLYTYE